MKIPSIEDLMRSAEVGIREKKDRLSKLSTSDPYKNVLRSEIIREEEALNRCRARVRDEKIDKLGL